METSHLRNRMPVTALTDPKILVPAMGAAFAKLDPRSIIKNPVMFVVEVVAAMTTVLFLRDLAVGARISGSRSRSSSGSGSRFCSPTLPRPWPKAAARRRPPRSRQTRDETRSRSSSSMRRPG